MITISDLNSPTFNLFPINNNRTAWRPYGLPIILAVPHKRSILGVPNANSMVFNVKVRIENVPNFAYVAGHDHVGLKFPNNELYGKTLDSMSLAERLIDVASLTYYRNGTEIAYENANTGDAMQYITASGVVERLTFIVGCDYYDLSDILLDVETLPPDNYNIVYLANYFTRIVSKDGKNQFICIDSNDTSLALFRSHLQHPGKVMEEMYRLTPVPYLTNASKSLDTTVALYRPFSDILQDIMDEQDILERVNWVYDCPIETIPYLSSMLGWDLPYFPKSLDVLRRSLLRRTAELQSLKGSRQAITSLFNLFGYEILITNLWWSSDGKRFIRPDESLPKSYKEQSIKCISTYQIDNVLANYTQDKFDTMKIPLLYRPQQRIGIDDFSSAVDNGIVTIDAYAVVEDSPAFTALQTICANINVNPNEYGADTVVVDKDGYLNPSIIHESLNGLELFGYSQAVLVGKFGIASDTTLAGLHPPLISSGISLNRDENSLHLTINGRYDIKDKIKIFVFATYERVDFVVPDILANLKSNRFGIQVLTPDLEEYADPITLDFAIEFVYKLKAFHSLLHVVRTKLESIENYEVTDIGIGGDYDQRYDTDMGRLQVPSAIIPNVPTSITDCALLDFKNLGYKDKDANLRLKKLELLLEEYEAWRSYDNRNAATVPGSLLAPPTKLSDRIAAMFNYRGQDRITTALREESLGTESTPSPNTNAHTDKNLRYAVNNVTPNNGTFNPDDSKFSINANGNGYGSFMREYTKARQGWPTLDNITDYKYKGRVDDEALHQASAVAAEMFVRRTCGFSLGSGTYYTYPSLSKVAHYGTSSPSIGSLSQKPIFTGGASGAHIKYYKEGTVFDYLNVNYKDKPPTLQRSLLGSKYRSYDTPLEQTLHYNDRIEGDYLDQRQFLAIQRPEIAVDKTDLHLPGCRFPTLNKLYADYTSSQYSARPWDGPSPCGVNDMCGVVWPNHLNYRLITDTDGNSSLQFDEIPYKVLGNGFKSDITSLGNHDIGTDSSFSETDVIHRVYMTNSSSNPAVVLDQVCDLDTSTIDGSIKTLDPSFNSYSVDPDSSGYYSDYADGYACVYGIQSYTPPDLGRGNTYTDLLAALGLIVAGTDSAADYLFTLGSGIKTGLGYRLDCGCSIFGMDDNTTAGDIGDTICASSIYKDQSGVFDFNMDHVRTNPYLRQDEYIEASTFVLNGSVTSLLETV